jgi:hypothetical protein
MAAIEMLDLFWRNVMGSAELSRIEMKTSPNTVSVENFQQMSVVLAAVVIAHDQGFAFAVGESRLDAVGQIVKSHGQIQDTIALIL